MLHSGVFQLPSFDSAGTVTQISLIKMAYGLSIWLMLSVLFVCVSPSSAQCNSIVTFNGTTANFTKCLTTSVGSTLAWTYDGRRLSAIYVCSPPRAYGWCGWGFSSNSRMIGSSAIIGYVDNNDTSKTKVAPFYLGGQTPRAVKFGGDLHVLRSAIEVNSDGTEIKLNFVLNLTKSNVLPYHIYAHGFATTKFNEGLLSTHPSNSQGSGTIDLITAAVVEVKTGHLKVKRVHAILATVGYGVLMPVGILISRHLKTFADPAWFYAHISIQVAGYALGLAGFAFGVRLKSWSSKVKYTHYGLGIAIFILSSIQILTPVLKPAKSSSKRFYWNLGHHNFGYGTVILAIINIFEGFKILINVSGYRGWRKAYVVFLIVWAAVFFALEIVVWALYFLRRKSADNEEAPVKAADEA